ncbi:MAG: hypothetical protein II527_03320, partial [Bacteroidales bacterium]|nr:hypothetical protein [Bacteroidales bacterium]
MIDHILLEFMEAMLRQTPTEFRRYAYNDINWNSRMIGIVGARGVGKSTLVKQYLLAINNLYALYASSSKKDFKAAIIEMIKNQYFSSGRNTPFEI